jgi:hypothetical protein
VSVSIKPFWIPPAYHVLRWWSKGDDNVIKFSDSTKNIFPAYIKYQEEVEPAKKTADNPYYKTKYATLDELIKVAKPALAKNGLGYLQDVIEDEKGRIGVYTMLIHVSGESLIFDPVYLKPDKMTPQGTGAAITYAKRYSLGVALGLATEEDDDGNSIEPQPPTRTKQSNHKRVQQQTRKQPQVSYASAQTMQAIRQRWEQLGYKPDSLNAQLAKLFGQDDITEEQGQEFIKMMDDEIRAQQDSQGQSKDQPQDQLAEGKMTDAQRKRLFGLGGKKGLTSDQVKKVCYYVNQIDTMKKMTKSQARDTIKLMEQTSGDELLMMIGEPSKLSEEEKEKQKYMENFKKAMGY